MQKEEESRYRGNSLKEKWNKRETYGVGAKGKRGD